MRKTVLGMGLTAVLLAGCQAKRDAKPSDVVGRDLPVTSSSSVALPGAVDAADAPRSPSVTESSHADLTLYRDPATGVSFRYPSVWRPAAAGVLVAPEFSAVAGPPRITQQFLPEGSVYAPTVLRALTFSYTARAHSSASECAALPAKASPNASGTRQVSFNGASFQEAVGGDAAMCTHVRAQVDSTLQGSQCLVFERDLVTSCPYVKSTTSPRPLTPGESQELQAQLDAVMASVQIARR